MKKNRNKPEESKPEKKLPYIEPKVLATYKKDDLEKSINPHGQVSGNGCGGCGCGCS